MTTTRRAFFGLAPLAAVGVLLPAVASRTQDEAPRDPSSPAERPVTITGATFYAPVTVHASGVTITNCTFNAATSDYRNSSPAAITIRNPDRVHSL